MNQSQEYFRFKWSHELKIHRMAVRLYNAVMRMIPYRLKYAVGLQMRARSYPYALIKDGSVVIQVGAPQDTLRAGRSRGMYFSLLVGSRGKVIIIEPDIDSLREYESASRIWNLRNLVLCPQALWSEKKKLRVYINDAHPASNFTEGTKDYDQELLNDYRVIELEADTLDHILESRSIDDVDLVSITTNGAERAILEGMSQTIATSSPIICLAKTGPDYVDMMAAYGYDLYSFDDRGYTFKPAELTSYLD